MAEENTTDSANSTDQADPNQADSQATDSSSSTTDDKTILTDDGGDKDADADKQDDKADDAGADKQDDTADADKDENALLGAPEGDYEITGLAEGVTVDKVALDALTPIAKEIGLSNEGMSKLAGVYAETILPHVTDTVVKSIESQIAATGKEWDAEARLAVEGGKDKDGKVIAADPVFDGVSMKDVRQTAARALDRFGGTDLREYLESTKLGNHPALVKAFYQVGKAIKEDGFERGDAAPQPKSRVDKYYPTDS